MSTVPWSTAMAESLHAPGSGFYAAGRGPGSDFRTAATVAPDLLADAFTTLFRRLPEGVRRQLVEIGAGNGALLAALAERLPPEVDLVGVERRARPPGLPPRVRWTEELPRSVSGLLIAVEWLDTVPVDVVADGALLLVDDEGRETPGPPPSREDGAWLARWWPGPARDAEGGRREVGSRRDAAWAEAVGRLSAGIAVAVDYGHHRTDRPPAGTLTGYRRGRVVPPVPDGDRDVTAAVAWDAVLAAVLERHPHLADQSVLTDQRAALHALGVRAALPARPAGPAPTSPAPTGYAEALRGASAARELTDPAGLGAFGWLMHAVAVPADVLPRLPGGVRP